MPRWVLAAASAVAVLAGALVSVGAGTSTAAAATCTTYHVIGARGSGEASDGFASMGLRVGAYAQQASTDLPAGQTVFENLPYPAKPVGADYFTSMFTGVEMLTTELESLISSCPNTRIGLIGYSQGAEVVHKTLDMFLTSAELGHIQSVLLLADPESAPDMPYDVSPTVDGSKGTHHGGGLLAENSLPIEIAGRSIDLCIQDDPVCDSPSVSALDTAASLLFNGKIHGMYNVCCGLFDYTTEGLDFAVQLKDPGDLNGGASGELGGVIPGPPLVTSLAGLADGTVLVTQDTNRVYKIVGGAPVWLSSCANNICPSPRLTTQAVIDAGPAVPRDGATASDEAGNIFKFVGGAPIHLSSCTVGCGTPVKITAWSIIHFNHMRPFPANGSTMEDESGNIFKFAGGAPVHLSSCALGCGTPVPITGVSISTLDHMRPFPADGTTIEDESGNIFKFAGGAPLHLSSCAQGCGSPVGITGASIAGLDHMRAVPANGTTIKDESGNIFKFAGGAPVHLSSCALGCGTPVPITGATIATLDHMRPFPADGTTIEDESGNIFKFAGGAPLHLSSCAQGCGSPVPITGVSIATLDHMRPVPSDGTTIQTETGTVYKFAGGAPLPLANCKPGCGSPVAITQGSVDNLDHMNAAPAAGTFVLAFETGALFRSSQGQAVPAGQCPGATGCTSAVVVNAASIAAKTGAAQSSFQANTGSLWTNGPTGGGTNTNLGMLQGTSPAAAALTSGAYVQAFQSNIGHLFIWNSTTGTLDTNLGMMAGTSPAVTALPNGSYEVAFQANTGHLFLWNSATGPADLGLGMKAATSPAIAASSSGEIEVAFQANTGNLFTWNSATGTFDTKLGMMAGTSPAIAALAGGGYETAFQANTGHLFTWNSAVGSADTNLGMMAGTSPAIAAALTGGYQVAFQANTGHLFTWNSATGTFDTNLGMMAGTSPAITTAPGTSGYEEAFQSNIGQLFIWSFAAGSTVTNLGMLPGTSPAITTSLTWRQ